VHSEESLPSFLLPAPLSPVKNAKSYLGRKEAVQHSLLRNLRSDVMCMYPLGLEIVYHSINSLHTLGRSRESSLRNSVDLSFLTSVGVIFFFFFFVCIAVGHALKYETS